MIIMEKEVVAIVGVFSLVSGLLLLLPEYMESMLYWLLLSVKPSLDTEMIGNK